MAHRTGIDFRGGECEDPPMGFYVELTPVKDVHGTALEFREEAPPPVFWTLFGFAGFALVCMGGAAYALLGDLFASGFWLDRVLVAAILSAVPCYLLIGLKLAFVRKFIRLDETISWGYRLGKKTIWRKEITRDELESFELMNHRPTPNRAQQLHDDSQYQIQGHWRVVVRTKKGLMAVLDKHTERAALEPLELSIQKWKLA